MSNLPPGVSVGMIPGNRSEELAEEAFWEEYDTRLREQHPDAYAVLLATGIIEHDSLMPVLLVVRDMAYSQGYVEGKADAVLEVGERLQDQEDSGARVASARDRSGSGRLRQHPG